jgi:SNF2 family DNA or RNA helicase
LILIEYSRDEKEEGANGLLSKKIKKTNKVNAVLIVVPASVLTHWSEQITKVFHPFKNIIMIIDVIDHNEMLVVQIEGRYLSWKK